MKGRRIYKDCEQKHLPRRGSKLKLGSLTEYRTTEKIAIQDQGEGTFRLKVIANEPFVVSPTELHVLRALPDDLNNYQSISKILCLTFGGTINGYGAYSSWNEDIDFHVRRRNSEVVIQGTTTIVCRSVDAFMFCMTLDSGGESVINDKKYDSRWSIAYEDAAEFEKRIGNAVVDQLGAGARVVDERLQALAFRSFQEMINLYSESMWAVAGRRGEVTYLGREFDLHEHSKEVIEAARIVREKPAFVKPKEFSREKEYRFAYWPQIQAGSNRHFISNVLRPIYIPAEDVLDLIEIH